jgi:hypothetical protein
MSGLRHLRVTEFVSDIKDGLTRPELMERYALTSRDLHRAFSKLVEAGLMTVKQLPEKLPFQYATLAQDNIRDLFRYDVDFELPIYDLSCPEVLGKVLNITREGVCLAGMKARVGEQKRLVTLGDDLADVKPFEFHATCRWFRRSRARLDHVSGFQITRISQGDLRELDQLIRVVSTGS